jgi:AcrR family transcriptional regulator
MVQARCVARAKPGSRSMTTADGRLTAASWEAAALAALAEHGVTGVAIEPLARRLGVTKGSFYWHFADRDALLAAALRRWEDASTERIIAGVAGVRDPRERLGRLIRSVLAASQADRLHVGLAAASHPQVREVFARVTRRRMAYLEACYVELGQAPREAARSALLAYTAYLGLVHLRLEAPSELPGGKAFAAYVDQLVARLMP